MVSIWMPVWQRLDINRDVFWSLIVDFATRDIVTARQLRQLLREGKRDEAGKRMHSLKGTAGILSATEVYRLADELERRLVGPPSQARQRCLPHWTAPVTLSPIPSYPWLMEEPEAAPAGNEPSSAHVARELHRLVTRNDPLGYRHGETVEGNAGFAGLPRPAWPS